MNDFLHFAFLGNFGGGEIILIFLVLLFLAIPVAIVLLVVFLLNKNKSPGPAPQAPRPLTPRGPSIQFLLPLRDCPHRPTRELLPPLRQASLTLQLRPESISFLCVLKGYSRTVS